MNSSCVPLSVLQSLTDTFTLLHSGISPMDLGLYDECLRNPNTSYFLANIILLTPTPITITNGFCLNKNCSAENVTSAVNELFNFAKIPAVGKATQITGNESSEAINGSTIFVIFLMCSLAAMGLIYPLYNFFKSYLNVKKDTSNYVKISEKNPDQEKALIENSKKEQKQISPILELIKCFSITDNWKKLWDVREGPLDFLNGVKSLAFFYVILGHEFAIRISILTRNPAEIPEILKTDYFEFLAAGFYAVDVFFWIGGFLVAFVLLDEKKILHLKKATIYPMAILHRYLRIIPAYLICLLFLWKIFSLTGSGPAWLAIVDFGSKCDNMWRNVLFIDSFFVSADNCMGWGWYLSNDFFLFIACLLISPLYLIKPILLKIMTLILMCASLLTSFLIIYNGEFGLQPYSAYFGKIDTFMDDYYFKVYCRASPYFFGFLFGIFYKEYYNSLNDQEANRQTFLFKVKKILEKHIIIKLMPYAIGLFIIFFFTYYPRTYKNDPNSWTNGGVYFWLTFQRIIYVFGLNLIFLNNFLGSNDWIRTILSWKLFGVVARLSFCGYLVHLIIILRFSLSSRVSQYVRVETLNYQFFSDLSLSLIFAVILSLFVEIPFINVENFVFRKDGNKKKLTENSCNK